MMCYKDMTFCESDCINNECSRFLSDGVYAGARKWWSHDPDNAPISMSDFSGDCKGYIADES